MRTASRNVLAIAAVLASIAVLSGCSSSPSSSDSKNYHPNGAAAVETALAAAG